MLVQDLLSASLRTILRLDPGDTATNSELVDTQTIANNLLDSLSAQALPIPNLTRDPLFPLTGLGAYTIGLGATFNTVRPIKLETASVVSSNGTSKPVDIVTVEKWNAVMDKTASGIFADLLYYDNAYPIATIYLVPKPGLGSNLDLYSYKPLAQFVNLGDPINLQPGYLRALRYMIAMEAALEFGMPVTQELVALAADAKTSIFGLNQAILGKPNMVEPTPAQ